MREFNANRLQEEYLKGYTDAVQEIANEMVRQGKHIEPNRPRGRWFWDKNGMDWNIGAWRCSECHGRNANLPNDEKIRPLMWSGSKFCPNCGAIMSEETDENI